MKCDKNNLLLYAVTDRYWLNGRSLCSVVKESLDGGVTFVQLREKKLDEAHFLEEAKELQQLCRSYHVPFVINDNVDIALAMDADGVHVGQSDMEALDVRAKDINDEMKIAAAHAIADFVTDDKLSPDYIIPSALDRSVSQAVAAAVAEAARKTGVARI